MNQPIDEQTKKLVEVEEGKQKTLWAIQRLFKTEDGKIVLDHFIKENCVVMQYCADPAKTAWLNSRHAFIMDLVATVQGPDFFAARIKKLLTPTENPDQSII